ncbi:MAG: AAA family ATPase [Bacteroidales bacterium]|nr:AAA family ATPase [Bacteroidales bacterium]
MLILNQNDRVGKYVVNYFIKEGLFNGTYKVSDEAGNAFFMKFFSLEAVPEKLLVDGTVMEIVHSRKVSHSNVISYVDDGEIEIDGGKYQYLVTEFLRGSLLSELLENGKTFPVPAAKEITIGILEGLGYLHSLKLYHNDITPRNIILEEVGKNQYIPRIIDLGHLCKIIGGNPPFPVNDLNLLYCAPEVLAGMFGDYGDIFAAAAVLYTMICGKAPWNCDIKDSDRYPDRKKAVRDARKEPLDTQALSAAGADDNLVAVIKAALNLSENDRLSLEDFLSALSGKDIVLPEESGSKEPSAPEKPRREKDPQKSATSVNVDIKKAQGGGFADVAGMESLKAELVNRVIWVLKDREKAEKYRLTPPNGMILYGPPGCGKTFFAEKFAEESHFNFVLVNGSDLGSIYVHGTQGKIADLFKEAEKKAPTILCFDEFDSFVPSRSSSAAEHRPEEVNEFLGQLNNCSSKGIFVIGTTNRIDLIDPAVLRKGRMDLHIEIPAPDQKTRSIMFGIHLKDRPVADDINLEELGALTENYASADIAFIVNEAAMTAALADVPISQAHLVNSIKSNKSSLPPKDKSTKIGF